MSLPVTFGTRNNYRTELIDFDIAHMELPYNAILSYPALAKFMMVTHHAYNTVKLPGSNDSITIRSDKMDAVRSVERAFKDAAAAFPDENEDLVSSDAPAKKKNLFKEDRTATKKVSLDANGSEATIVIGSNLLPK